MELDKRIIEGKKPLDCFDTEQAKEFLGKECYFSDRLCTFNELLDAYSYVTADVLVSKEKHLYVGELLTVSDSDGSCYEAGINGEAEWFQFCLPCEWVKPEEPEKKYRSFSLNEFTELYVIGDVVTYRIKDCEVTERAMFIGCQSRNDEDIPGNGYVLIGNCRYGIMELFNNYELFKDGEWQPFGVMEDD